MDYGDILKRAWRVTWRYKALWVLGLFVGAGGGSGGSGGGSNYRSGSGGGTNPFSTYQWTQFVDFLRSHIVAITIAVTLLVLFGFVMWVLGVAARGGLIHLANEAEEGRQVRLRQGWSVGFRKWWRVFGVEFLTALPLILFALVLGVFAALVVVSAVSRGVPAGDFGAALASIAVAGVCFVIIFGVLAAIVGTILGIVAQIAERYVILKDYRVRESIGQGWRDLWAKRGAFVMFLVTIGTGIAFGIMLIIVAVLLVIPAAVALFARAWVAAALLLFGAFLVLLLPSAIYGTFYSSMWTVFFRKMTGMEPAAPAVATAYAPPFPQYAPPPAPSVPPAPPAPPVPPVPPAPAEPSGPADA